MEQIQDRDFSMLLKSNWFASDIEAYYGISKSTADYIKKSVENLGHIPPCDKGKERRSVIADEVIKFMGGKDRLTEIQILNELRNYERG